MADTTSKEKSEGKKGAFILIALIVIFLSIRLAPNPIEFKEDVFKQVTPTLSYLLVIAVFMERSIEVFLSAWRGRGADFLDNRIREYSGKIKILMEDFKTEKSDDVKKAYKKEIDTLEKKLFDKKIDRTKYRAESREKALWAGVLLGIGIAAVGVRALDSFIAPISYYRIGSFHKTAFTIFDILITGCVLAGGSETINKMTKVYTNFMTSTAEKAKERKTSQAAV